MKFHVLYIYIVYTQQVTWWGGGERFFWNSENDMKHTFLRKSGGMPPLPENLFHNDCPEIESGGFWQRIVHYVYITCVLSRI